ncbi:MAG: 6-carboxytetrahydropterin synthase, partial [Bacteroidota bacterium]|nr:6-carboxytetrahydropterin synthase [Bacteroidota bacterium]
MKSSSQTFSAAHKLPNYDGNCRRLHGHTWKAEIRIDSEIDPTTGMV